LDLLDRDARDDEAAVGQGLDEPERLEPPQRLADGNAADAEVRGDVVLSQRRSLLEDAGGHRFANRLGDDVGDRGSRRRLGCGQLAQGLRLPLAGPGAERARTRSGCAFRRHLAPNLGWPVWAVIAPSASTLAPLTNCASSDSRNRMTFA